MDRSARTTSLFSSPSNSPLRMPVQIAAANRGCHSGASDSRSGVTSSARSVSNTLRGTLRRSTAAAGFVPLQRPRLIALPKIVWSAPRRVLRLLGDKAPARSCRNSSMRAVVTPAASRLPSPCTKCLRRNPVSPTHAIPRNSGLRANSRLGGARGDSRDAAAGGDRHPPRRRKHHAKDGAAADPQIRTRRVPARCLGCTRDRRAPGFQSGFLSDASCGETSEMPGDGLRLEGQALLLPREDSSVETPKAIDPEVVEQPCPDDALLARVTGNHDLPGFRNLL